MILDKGGENLSTLIRLTGYLKKYWPATSGVIAAVFIATGLGLIPPWLIRYGIDNYIIGNNPRFLWIIGALMVVVTLVQGFLDYLKKYITEFIAQRVIHDIRTELYQHLNSLSFAFYDYSRTGDIMSRVIADINLLQGFLANASIYIAENILTIVGIFIVLIFWNLQLSLLYLLMIPFMVFGMYQYSNRVAPMFKKVRKKFASLNEVIQEDLAGIEVIKLFGRENKEEEDFRQINQQYTDINITSARVSAFWLPYVNFFMGVGTALVIWTGGRLVISNTISLGVLAGFTGYIAMLFRPIRKTGMMVNFGSQALAAAERVFEVMDESSDIQDSPAAYPLPKVKGQVEYRNVSFSYQNGKEVLKKIDFKVEPGQTIAVVGPTGAGKSTLVHLLPRFYDPVQGEVLIDGHNIKDVNVESLRQQVGIVLQQTFLFAASIKENISYGKPDASREEIIEAARIAQIDEFIQSLPLGYETPVGERGVNLSGGQRQRLAMARVLLTGPGLLILDEPTSSVDVETEEKMQQALAGVIKGRTTFIIAHRLWTIKNADKIIVLDDGEIIEEGNHQTLVNAGGFYSRINLNNPESLRKDMEEPGDME